jgi:hypothetical protein
MEETAWLCVVIRTSYRRKAYHNQRVADFTNQPSRHPGSLILLLHFPLSFVLPSGVIAGIMHSNTAVRMLIKGNISTRGEEVVF